MALYDRYRIMTYVPLSHLEKVKEAVCNSGFLTYGNYDKVLWVSAEGDEQYEPLENSNPRKGKIGKLEKGTSFRLEFSIDKNDEKLKMLLNNFLLPAHPWEEPIISILECKENINFK